MNHMYTDKNYSELKTGFVEHLLEKLFIKRRQNHELAEYLDACMKYDDGDVDYLRSVINRAIDGLNAGGK